MKRSDSSNRPSPEPVAGKVPGVGGVPTPTAVVVVSDTCRGMVVRTVGTTLVGDELDEPDTSVVVGANEEDVPGTTDEEVTVVEDTGSVVDGDGVVEVVVDTHW